MMMIIIIIIIVRRNNSGSSDSWDSLTHLLWCDDLLSELRKNCTHFYTTLVTDPQLEKEEDISVKWTLVPDN